jgi:glucosamine-6-phosphate deaminase
MDPRRIMELPANALGQGTSVRVRVGGDVDDLARLMAEEMADLIRSSAQTGRPATAIIPVGPVGQYPILAEILAREPLDASRVSFVTMDEFLDDAGAWIDEDHPLSFRGHLRRAFFDRLPASCGFRPENWIVPDPNRPEAVGQAIADRGGVDVCWGGIGLNGHLAFNEPEPEVSVAEFADRTCRTLEIAPESRAHMAINLSCVLDLIPRRAVTIGMREILAARKIRLYANRPWQRGVVRWLLHGPVSAACPASLIRRHPDAGLTLAEFVAQPVEVGLR